MLVPQQEEARSVERLALGVFKNVPLGSAVANQCAAEGNSGWSGPRSRHDLSL